MVFTEVSRAVSEAVTGDGIISFNDTVRRSVTEPLPGVVYKENLLGRIYFSFFFTCCFFVTLYK